MSKPGTKDRNIPKSLHHLEGVNGKSAVDYANFINAGFLTPMENFEKTFFLQQQTVAGDFTDEITLMNKMSTFKKLTALNPTKAQDPDAIPEWFLNENADLLAGPICDILNCTHRNGVYLQYGWKLMSSQFQSNDQSKT